MSIGTQRPDRADSDAGKAAFAALGKADLSVLAETVHLKREPPAAAGGDASAAAGAADGIYRRWGLTL
jgi:hypothetical protein